MHHAERGKPLVPAGTTLLLSFALAPRHTVLKSRMTYVPCYAQCVSEMAYVLPGWILPESGLLVDQGEGKEKDGVPQVSTAASSIH
eukprot:2253024-Rhodomonas_salina.1